MRQDAHAKSLKIMFTVVFILVPTLSGAQPHAYVATFDGSVGVIDTATNAVVTTIPGVTGLSAAAHPDGATVYVTATNAVAVVSTATNTIADTIPLSGSPSRLVVSANGARLYAISFPGTVWVIDTETNVEIDSFAATGTAHRGLELHPTSQTLYVPNQNEDTVSVIAVPSNLEVDTIDVGDGPFNVEMHPDGGTLFVANFSGATVSVVDTTANTEVTAIAAGSAPFALAIHPGGDRLYVTDESAGAVLVIDTATNSVIDTVTVGALPQGIAVHPDGHSVYVANGLDDNVSVIATATNTVVATIATPPGPFSVGDFISPPANVFGDGFESGGTSFWSGTVGN